MGETCGSLVWPPPAIGPGASLCRLELSCSTDLNGAWLLEWGLSWLELEDVHTVAVDDESSDGTRVVVEAVRHGRSKCPTDDHRQVLDRFEAACETAQIDCYTHIEPRETDGYCEPE